MSTPQKCVQSPKMQFRPRKIGGWPYRFREFAKRTRLVMRIKVSTWFYLMVLLHPLFLRAAQSVDDLQPVRSQVRRTMFANLKANHFANHLANH